MSRSRARTQIKSYLYIVNIGNRTTGPGSLVLSAASATAAFVERLSYVLSYCITRIYIYAMRYHASSHPFVRPEWRCVCCVSTPIHVNTTTAAQMNGAQNTCENGYIRVELNSACQCITFISTYLPDERRPKNTFSLVRNTRMNECLSTACTHAAAIQNAFLSCWAWTFAVFCCLIFLHADAHLCVEHTQQKHNNNVKCGAF